MTLLQHPIIALWVHPRSMSTAVERIMRERGDLECLHEPFMYYYYVGLGKKELPHSELHIGRLDSFEEIVADMETRAKSAPVFFKDMSYYILPEIYNHPRLATRLKHIFLIRDPKKSILSYYKLDPKFSMEEVGIEAHWNLFNWLSENNDIKPYVIQAEAVQRDPIEALTKAWNHIGLETIDSAFSWESGAVPKDWQSVSGWHQSVISSSGIRKADADQEFKLDQDFEQAALSHPMLRQYLDHHRPFYEKLKAVSLSQE